MAKLKDFRLQIFKFEMYGFLINSQVDVNQI